MYKFNKRRLGVEKDGRTDGHGLLVTWFLSGVKRGLRICFTVKHCIRFKYVLCNVKEDSHLLPESE